MHPACHFLFQCWLLLCLSQTLLCTSEVACTLTWNQTPIFCIDNIIHLFIANICHVAYRTFAPMISFPGGRGYITRTLSQSSSNQGSTVASGLWKRKYRNKQTIMAISKKYSGEITCECSHFEVINLSVGWIMTGNLMHEQASYVQSRFHKALELRWEGGGEGLGLAPSEGQVTTCQNCYSSPE